MKKAVFTIFMVIQVTCLLSQVDTLSYNIYQDFGRLGIGNENPEYLIDIRDNVDNYSLNPKQFIFLHNTNNSSLSNVAIAMRSGLDFNESRASFGLTSNYYSAIPGIAGMAYIYNVNNGIALRANSENGVIKFITGGNSPIFERMKIDSTGNIGVGTKNPKAKLEISEGDVYISDIEKGIIMKSPDGQCWRGVLDNTGNLRFSVIACPEQKNSQSIRSEKSAGMVNVYPNPTENELYIELLNDELIKSNYSVYTINGQLLNTGIINTTREVLNIAFLEKGVFILEIHDVHGNKIKAEKFIKK